jgi:hypothetical protein
MHLRHCFAVTIWVSILSFIPIGPHYFASIAPFWQPAKERSGVACELPHFVCLTARVFFSPGRKRGSDRASTDQPEGRLGENPPSVAF